MKHPRAQFPLVTLVLAAAIFAVYGLELAGDGLELCERFGFVPARPSVAGAVTSLFLHDPATVVHVAGNLVFLVAFGTIVERALGSLRFLALYVAAGLGGAALHGVVAPSSTMPLVGASGALFGLLAVAAVLNPRLLGFAVAFAATNVWAALHGGDGTASFGAHIGGFATGVLVVVLARLRGVELGRRGRRAGAFAAG